MDEKYQQLKQWVAESSNIVFFGGAGVSTESGIPDFRGKNGLYRKKREIPLETILSHDFFVTNPEKFYSYLRTPGQQKNVQPNQAHIRLAELEREGKLKAVITQNVDGLHQAAGSKTVYELHGNGSRFFCMQCRKEFPQEEIEHGEGVPHCECGGLIRPGIVLYGEPLDEQVVENAVRAIQEADLLIIGGTSLTVYPAAGLINYYSGNRLVLINENSIPYDQQANLILADQIGKVFSEV